MKKVLIGAIAFLFSSVVFATGGHESALTTTGVTTTGIDLSTCNGLGTSATVNGIGSSLTNASSTAMATANVGSSAPGAVAGRVETDSVVNASNVSTGSGVGSLNAFTNANGAISAQNVAVVPHLGTVGAAGSATSWAGNTAVITGSNFAGGVNAVNVGQFNVTSTLSKVNGVPTASVVDTKAALSQVTVTGIPTASGDTSGYVKASGFAETRAPVVQATCFTTHDVNGTPSTNCH